ncbi:Surface protein PspC, partial [human gut metagenome]
NRGGNRPYSSGTNATAVCRNHSRATKGGNITNAVAFNGGYVYDGYRTDDDDTSVYYNNGTKDVEVDADEDYNGYPLEKYGTKYATIVDGNDTDPYDNYLLDLSTGKIDDDESVGDKQDNAQNKLKTKLSKTDRYGKNSITNFDPILTNKYGEVWYQYSAEGDDDAADRTTGAGVGYYQGYSNDSGKYIDVTQDANIYLALKFIFCIVYFIFNSFFIINFTRW